MNLGLLVISQECLAGKGLVAWLAIELLLKDVPGFIRPKTLQNDNVSDLSPVLWALLVLGKSPRGLARHATWVTVVLLGLHNFLHGSLLGGKESCPVLAIVLLWHGIVVVEISCKIFLPLTLNMVFRNHFHTLSDVALELGCFLLTLLRSQLEITLDTFTQAAVGTETIVRQSIDRSRTESEQCIIAVCATH